MRGPVFTIFLSHSNWSPKKKTHINLSRRVDCWSRRIILEVGEKQRATARTDGCTCNCCCHGCNRGTHPKSNKQIHTTLTDDIAHRNLKCSGYAVVYLSLFGAHILPFFFRNRFVLAVVVLVTALLPPGYRRVHIFNELKLMDRLLPTCSLAVKTLSLRVVIEVQQQVFPPRYGGTFSFPAVVGRGLGGLAMEGLRNIAKRPMEASC